MSGKMSVSCSACGKIISVDVSKKLPKNYCNKYCKNTDDVRTKKRRVNATLRLKGKKCKGCNN